MRRPSATLFVSLVVVFLCHLSATDARGQSAVFGPKKYVRQEGTPQTVTDTFSVQDTAGPFTLSIQNGADGAGGTSSAVVELNGVQVAGPSDFNNRLDLIRKSVFLQQSNSISVEVRGKPGSSVTVAIREGAAPPTSTQFTLFTNPTDPLWLREETPEGDVIDFYGGRDSEGLPTTLYGFIVTYASGDEVTYYLDELGRPVLVGAPNGVTFKFDWQPDTHVLVTAFFAYGDGQVTVPIDVATQSAKQTLEQPIEGTFFSPASFTFPQQSGFNLATFAAQRQGILSSPTSVRVTRCGAPARDAFVRIPVDGLSGPPILAQPVFGQPGLYIASLPTPPPNFAQPIHKACARIQKAISNACEASDAIKRGGVEAGQMCSALTQAGESLGDPDFGPALEFLGSSCSLTLKGLGLLCSAAKPCVNLSGYVDRKLTKANTTPITYRAIATLYGITKCSASVTAPPRGPFPPLPTIDFPCSCQSGPGARLFSTQRDIKIAVLPPEADFTDEIRLSSPVFRNIATNRYTGPPIDISSYRVGAELIFSIFVRETGQTFYTGPGSRNPDGLVHAKVECLRNGRVRVSFEDTFGGGDNDFNDAVFEIISGSFQGPVCR